MKNNVCSRFDMSFRAPPEKSFLLQNVNVSPSLARQDVTTYVDPLRGWQNGVELTSKTSRGLEQLIGLGVLDFAKKDPAFCLKNKKLVTFVYSRSDFGGHKINYVYTITSKVSQINKTLWFLNNFGDQAEERKKECRRLFWFGEENPTNEQLEDLACRFPNILLENNIQMFRFFVQESRQSMENFESRDLGFLRGLITTNNIIPRRWSGLEMISPTRYWAKVDPFLWSQSCGYFNCEDLLQDLNFGEWFSTSRFLSHLLCTIEQVQNVKDFAVLKKDFRSVSTELLYISFEILDL